MNKARAFISCSGTRSKIVARALGNLIESLIPGLDPFVSETKIGPGARWRSELFPALHKARFAIVCLTPENLRSPWLHFEAGAVSDRPRTSVFTYLLGVRVSDVRGPLAEFNHTRANFADTFRMLKYIAGAAPKIFSTEADLERALEQSWAAFDTELTRACHWQPDPKDEAEAFWAPYRRMEPCQRIASDNKQPSERATRLFYTEPRFWRYDRLFLRCQDDNSFDSLGNVRGEHAPEAALLPEEVRAGIAKLPFVCAHQFVSAGEAACLATLTLRLHELGVPIKLSVSRHRKSRRDLLGDDLIVIGNIRTHWAVREFQEDLDIVLDERKTIVRNARDGEQEEYPDDSPGRNERTVYSVVSRLILDSNQVVTVIAANNGRAFEAVAECLCDSSLLRRILPIGPDLSRPLPSKFQLLLKTKLSKDDTATSQAQLVTHRGFPT